MRELPWKDAGRFLREIHQATDVEEERHVHVLGLARPNAGRLQTVLDQPAVRPCRQEILWSVPLTARMQLDLVVLANVLGVLVLLLGRRNKPNLWRCHHLPLQEHVQVVEEEWDLAELQLALRRCSPEPLPAARNATVRGPKAGDVEFQSAVRQHFKKLDVKCWNALQHHKVWAADGLLELKGPEDDGHILLAEPAQPTSLAGPAHARR